MILGTGTKRTEVMVDLEYGGRKQLLLLVVMEMDVDGKGEELGNKYSSQ